MAKILVQKGLTSRSRTRQSRWTASTGAFAAQIICAASAAP